MTDTSPVPPAAGEPAAAGQGAPAGAPPPSPPPAPEVSAPPAGAPLVGAPIAQVGHPYPFVSAPRPPRALWINPNRRAHVAAVAVVIALVCGGAGVGVGWAVSDGGGRHGVFRMGPGGPYGRDFGPGPGRLRPLQPNLPTPSPAPTTS